MSMGLATEESGHRTRDGTVERFCLTATGTSHLMVSYMKDTVPQ
jgi:hypothetical protein